MKTIKVNISETLSSTQEIEVPDNFDTNDENALLNFVRDQVYLPDDSLLDHMYYNWVVDDLCVYEEKNL